MAACNKEESVETTPATTILETTEGTMPGSVIIEEIILDPRALYSDATETTDSAEEAEGTETVESLSKKKESTDIVESTETESTIATETLAGETTAATEIPTTSEVKEESVASVRELTEYEKYTAMSGDEQMAFMETFTSVSDFINWYNNAKAEYESSIVIIDGSVIDAQEIMEDQH